MSAGKRPCSKTRKGNKWLRRVLIEAAQSAARTKHKYFAALYHRQAVRRGKKHALVAIGHSLLVAGYTLLTRQVDDQDWEGRLF